MPPRPTVLWWNVADHPVEIACELVVGFRVVTRVGDNVADASALQCRPQHPPELVDVGLGTSSSDCREDQMVAGITGQAQLRKATVPHALNFLGVALLPLNEVAAGVSGLEARGIDGGDFYLAA
jgi:hypothetical protein